MTERERLIEILRCIPPLNINIGGRRNGKHLMAMQHIADHLLANGVIVPPCKVGDRVWLLYTDGFIEELEIDEIVIGKNHDIITFTNDSCFTVWGKDHNYYFKWVFLTKEEAEKALAERKER